MVLSVFYCINVVKLVIIIVLCLNCALCFSSEHTVCVFVLVNKHFDALTDRFNDPIQSFPEKRRIMLWQYCLFSPLFFPLSPLCLCVFVQAWQPGAVTARSLVHLKWIQQSDTILYIYYTNLYQCKLISVFYSAEFTRIVTYINFLKEDMKRIKKII